MKVLFVYNSSSGKQSIVRRIPKIRKKLTKFYGGVDIIASTSAEHFASLCHQACAEYDLFIFSGGDGTFNMVVNEIAHEPKKPILALIPSGTINDAGKNFGLNKNVNRCLRIIKKQKTKEIDIVKINDYYFVYVAAAGLFSDIPLQTKQRKKKIFGFLAYYSKAIKQVFQRKTIKGQVILDNGRIIPFETPFIMFLNSKRVGGFTVNPKANLSDGKIDFFITKRGPFNGLFAYLFQNPNIERYEVKEAKIHLESEEVWDIDGEKGPVGDITVTVLPRFLRMIVK